MTSPAAAAQIAAADPSVNIWLVANAGSGKTRVLTDRVARLLLRGVDPQNILCLTYTKAAAAEMQNRLFKRLGEWAMAPEPKLRIDLAELGESADLSVERMRLARQLFARAIETPGGIRIQTIHSFCAGLLRRFPLEAGVSPAFTEIDERSAALLRAEVFDAMAEGPEQALVTAVLADAPEDLENFLDQIIKQRAGLTARPDPAKLRAEFGLSAGADEASLLDSVFLGGEADLLAQTLAALQSGSPNDQKAGEKLKLVAPFSATLETLSTLETVLLTGSGAKQPYTAKTGDFPTKPTRETLGALMGPLHGLMARVETARPLRLALSAMRQAETLNHFGTAFLARYEAAKSRRGWLDFDDLILRATDLLTDPAIAPWVLYRLDGFIDHILVDEAQDTSPAQWRIIAALSSEFTAGESARRAARSLFVVGDKKQSIYSFQGADVAAFDTVKQGFARRFRGAGETLLEKPLVHSFRSSGAILQVVDRCFRDDAMTAAMGGAFDHKPFHETLPGRVDLWPPVPKAEAPDPKDWFDPVDLIGEDDAMVVLARQIAREIGTMIDRGVQIPRDPKEGGFRPVRPGDFLILVQRRKDLFHEIIRACKAENLPIAGADRLKLAEELAVRDILALLSFLNTPEDDLALATVLKSPLFGWSEQRLFQLAQSRKGYLWEALRNAPGNADTLDILNDLRDRAEFLRPFELIDRLLTRHRGRVRLLGRLGEEAADAIDELLAQALAYEAAEVPSLTGFLVWMEAGDVEAKRQAESEGQQIRVMTVHGAKGLEAPVVILPETADRDLREQDMLVALDGVVAWAGRAEENPPALTLAKAARRRAREAENLRLLYVAMTRAKTWLIVAGSCTCGENSWHGLIARALESLPLTDFARGAKRYQQGNWPEDAPEPADRHVVHEPLPEWAMQPAKVATDRPRTYAPSGLGGAKVVAGESTEPEEDSLVYGADLHLLLEHLPQVPRASRADMAARLGLGEELLRAAETILTDSALDWIFAPGTMAEAALSAPWNGGVLAGTVDRLVVAPDRVTVIDFKSNTIVPQTPEAVPEAYLRQMGAYAQMLTAIYPGRQIETAILWTRVPKLMPLPLDIVRDALMRATIA